MDRYSFLRTLADSWVLLVLVLIFLGVILFAWRPGSRPLHRDAARSIFRNERRPAPPSDQTDHERRPAPPPNETDPE